MSPLIDDKCYTVTAPNGFRRGSLDRMSAEDLARRMHEDMRRAGWAGTVRVHYRDGSIVWAASVGQPTPIPSLREGA